MAFQMEDYVDVAERIVEFRTKHPEGSFQCKSLEFREFAGKSWVIYSALAYRTADDQRPGEGTAWEQVPGKTPYTKDSELQNAETSAWGRAVVAALAADTKRGIATKQEARTIEANDPVAEAKARVWELAKRAGWSVTDLSTRYVTASGGKAISNATAAELHAYADSIEEAE